MKKYSRVWVIVMIMGLMLAGCTKNSGEVNQGKDTVDDVLDAQINDEDVTETPEDEIMVTDDVSEPEEEPDKSVDYDLTVMGADMVYATVFQFMSQPEKYVGKTVKMDGLYYAAQDESTKKYYHCVIIQDAMACCEQGMEFVWDDGKHVYPDEYPKDETEVTVTGVFETYKEKGDSNEYCRLKDATLIVNADS